MRLRQVWLLNLAICVLIGIGFSNKENTSQNITIPVKLPTSSESIINVASDKDRMEIGCLAKNIYFESRGESKEGQAAVGIVTINRALSKDFPNTICGVVYQRSKHDCQFSWTCDNKKDVIRAYGIYDTDLEISRDLYFHYYVNHDHKQKLNALYYATKKATPKSWHKHLILVSTIGHHNFFTAR